MASGAHNKGVTDLLDGTSPYLTTTLKVMLLGTATPYTYNPDNDVVDAGGANDPLDAEIAVTGYVGGWGGAGRKTLASKTVTENDTNNRVEFDAADVSWTGLAAGATIEAAEVIREGGANDTTSRLFVYLDPTNLATNGSDVTLQFPANGFLHFNIV
jgi:hypothetical protein